MTRILHLSDPHFGAVDNDIAEIFLQTANAMKPDMSILSGDLTMRARRTELAAARAFIDRLPTPHLIIPGNHDIPLINQPYDRFFRSFKRYQDFIARDLEPELIVDGIHVVSLNSSRAFGFHADWSEGRLSHRQLSQMQHQFRNSPPGRRRILVLHHPLLELQIPDRPVVKPLKNLLQAMEAAHVDIVMCGHFHRSQILLGGLTVQWKSIISQAPTVCSTRTQGEPQGFHELLISGERVETIRHVFHEGAFVPAGSSVFTLDETGWNNAFVEKGVHEIDSVDAQSR
jgi:3',5'-cyclic AMP phosphodiesterase CpdA